MARFGKGSECGCMKIKMNVHLDKVLSKKYNRKNVNVRVGDRVKLIRGSFKGKTGKVVEIDRKKQRVKVEGVEIAKANSSFQFIHLCRITNTFKRKTFVLSVLKPLFTLSAPSVHYSLSAFAKSSVYP